jgi:hypothetical protein
MSNKGLSSSVKSELARQSRLLRLQGCNDSFFIQVDDGRRLNFKIVVSLRHDTATAQANPDLAFIKYLLAKLD